ncbi:hypothetical protein [Streptomyces sp. NPDC005907]|uniref:hypothetical protein n=1 Tax=Streptomyces sp. NPDC005907 TaxID=3154571 RepID=UPI0034032DCA
MTVNGYTEAGGSTATVDDSAPDSDSTGGVVPRAPGDRGARLPAFSPEMERQFTEAVLGDRRHGL